MTKVDLKNDNASDAADMNDSELEDLVSQKLKESISSTQKANRKVANDLERLLQGSPVEKLNATEEGFEWLNDSTKGNVLI